MRSSGDSRLRNRVAIVTGASSGVGWQSAARLADAGVRLCITARRGDALEKLRAQIITRGGECLVIPGDVTLEADVERVVAQCLQHYGHVDMLVNCAAVQSYAPFEHYEWREIARVFDVTCFGYMRFARAVLPHFRVQGHGHIINVLSMLSKGAAPLLSAYTAAKHAAFGWAESLRLELAGSGIDISGVLVPSVATPMFDHAPTKLGFAPRPVPPTYDPDVAARAVLQCARRPHPAKVPVFLQGRLILWLQRWAPWVGETILKKWGVRLQTRGVRLSRPEGNLFQPIPEGVGPYGSVPPTPAWQRIFAASVIWALAGLAVLAGALLIQRLAQLAR
jgi:short-subunit dehydrogenase